MRFACPQLLLVVFAGGLGVALFLLWAHRARRAALSRFAEAHLVKELSQRIDFKKRRTKQLLLASALVLALFSLARPQWGFQWQEVKRRGLDVIIALDTSKSMLAEDIKPDRFGRAQLAVKDFTRYLRGDRIGLIAFSGSAFLQCPLTVDYSGFLFTLQSMDTDTIPRGGTSLDSAIREALEAFESGMKKYKVLVIITDGEAHEGDALQAAEEARKEGVIIHCIGVGTAEGELIPVIGADGQRAYLKDAQGNVVKSRLDERLLQRIALATGGSYVRTTAREFGLEALYREKISQMEKRDLEGSMARRFHERFQIPLGIALLLLFIEPLISETRKR